MITEHSIENKVSVVNIKGPRKKIYTPFCAGCCGYSWGIRKYAKLPRQYKKTIRDHRRGKSRLKKTAFTNPYTYYWD